MSDDPIVGHKTFTNDDGTFRHEPLHKSEADSLWVMIESEKKRREELIPDERTALRLMHDCYTRLKDFGWNDACYAPVNKRPLEFIELGSTGIHSGHCEEVNWSSHPVVWLTAHGDLWPSKPILYREPVARPDRAAQDGGAT